MTDTDQKEDEVLKRMLKTPPKKHERGGSRTEKTTRRIGPEKADLAR